ncbi:MULTISPECIES: TetR/AcrR family transcriptional regulator [unclassified Knoellia]|uniref:TetR/AcrR family transcriptional regulator n=1 Tax=Knoellia altitudinis TaxID=3404795 RepID=UPI003607B2BA
MTTTRERLRAETLEEIKAAARARLAVDGANLSLRAVARDVGLVSSAVYRYFPSRDALLTALIIDSYNDMGEAVEAAEAAQPREDLHARFVALAGAIRDWALSSPNEYALIFGSPVPGYAAPQDTLAPAMRVTTVLAGLLADGLASGALTDPGDPVDEELAVDLAALTAAPPFVGVPLALMARGMAAWSAVYGLVSFELFHAYGPLTAPAALFEHQVLGITRQMGLVPPSGRAPRQRARGT